MIYWLKEKQIGCKEEQVAQAIKAGRLLPKDYTLLEDADWKRLRDEAIRLEKDIATGADGYPHIVDVVRSEKDNILDEIHSIDRWLREHDYIGIKIATGRATREEYESTIYEMNAKAARLNELKKILKEKK